MPHQNVLSPNNTITLQLPVVTNPWQALSFIALQHLITEHGNGFVHTKHIMPFPKEIFKTTEDFQVGDVFQRALILDTLLDIDPVIGNQLQDIITAEANYLINIRRTRGVGGWAYFPGLPELPPDADDLAQVMQVLSRAGFEDVAAPLFETPLNVLLTDQANSDNGWESWIIPTENQTEEQQLQTEWVNTAWGKGSDIEVVANLIYALTLFNADRFATAINRGITFLLNSHENKYCWKSTWYYGNYYGTYVAIRALCAANAPQQTITGAIAFLEATRLSNGSWGLENQDGNALQTSLALLALSIAKKHLGLTFNESWLESSLAFLSHNTTPETGWASAPFIQMPMGRPYGFVHTTLTYQSATITNNYVAKACNHIYLNHIS